LRKAFQIIVAREQGSEGAGEQASNETSPAHQQKTHAFACNFHGLRYLGNGPANAIAVKTRNDRSTSRNLFVFLFLQSNALFAYICAKMATLTF
jgi:hypothetical protein